MLFLTFTELLLHNNRIFVMQRFPYAVPFLCSDSLTLYRFYAAKQKMGLADENLL